MGIIYPKPAIASKWAGALQARVRRTPLEAFLLAQGETPSAGGVSRDSDNVTRATIMILGAAIEEFLVDHPHDFLHAHPVLVGRLACLVSRTIAESIANPAAWRIAALV